MKRALGHLALAGVLLSLATHVAVLLGIDVAERIPVVWVLETGLFLLLVPLVFSFAGTFGNRPDLARLHTAFPRWVLGVGLFLFVYAVINSICFGYSSVQVGSPELDGGRFVLVDQGKVVRVVALSTYTELRRNELRGFSGYWLILYFVLFAWFTFFRKPNAEAAPQQSVEKPSV